MTILASRTVSSRLARVATTTSSSSSASSSSRIKHYLPSSQIISNKFFLSTDSSSASTKSSLTREDVTDSNGLLQFKTLHEMNTYASIAFRDNPLFGTYKPPLVEEENVVKDKAPVDGPQGTFEWMTYGEYGDMIGRCRTVLKDIGK